MLAIRDERGEMLIQRADHARSLHKSETFIHSIGLFRQKLAHAILLLHTVPSSFIFLVERVHPGVGDAEVNVDAPILSFPRTLDRPLFGDFPARSIELSEFTALDILTKLRVPTLHQLAITTLIRAGDSFFSCMPFHLGLFVLTEALFQDVRKDGRDFDAVASAEGRTVTLASF